MNNRYMNLSTIYLILLEIFRFILTILNEKTFKNRILSIRYKYN